MASPAILKLEIIADATKAQAAMGKTSEAATGMSSKLGSVAKMAAGAFATGAIINFGKASVGAATESAVATARLGQVFKSMGDETGEAAKAAEVYAAALSKKIGVDDDSIMAAQAQLATFGAVSNETARAAGIFDRTTAAAADLAAAGFGTLDSNSVQLGKALQDPIKGLAALGKSGVTFTDAQKEMIAGMVASGDAIGAQKVVLKAVEDQVGGTAAATVTSQQKMSVAFGETQEAVGNALLPALEALAPVLQSVAGFVEENIGWLLPFAAGIAAVVLAVKGWSLATEVWSAITKIAAGVQWLFNAAMSANPVMLAVAAIAALAAGVVLAYQNVEGFRNAVDAAWQFIQKAWDGVLKAFQKVWDWIKSNWPLLLAILTGPIGLAVLAIVKHWDTIKAAINTVWTWIKDTWSAVTGFLTKPISAAVDGITAAWDRILTGLQRIFDGIKNAASAVWTWVTDKFHNMVENIRNVIGGVRDVVSDIVGAIKAPINAVIRGWNRLEFRVPRVDLGPFGSVGGQSFSPPNISTLDKGGTVLRTGLAIVHAGEQFSGVGKTYGSSQVINVHVTAAGLGADAPEIQRAVVKALRGYVGRNGPLPIPVRSVA